MSTLAARATTGFSCGKEGFKDGPFSVGEISAAEDAELFLYHGDQHYFADSTLPSYDMDAAALLLKRVLGFLRTR